MTGQSSPAIDRLLAGAVADGVAPGLVGAVADRDGLLHHCACGVRNIETGGAMTVDTIVWLASMTKLVTTIAAMMLVEAGDLDLDAPVADLLPELAHPRVLDGDGTRPAQTAITLRHLLTHRSGIGYELMNPALHAARGPAGPPPATTLASLHGPLAAEPGTGWTYGYGIDWAGIMIERRSGIPLDRYFADRIFRPLGMHDTGFVPQGPVATTYLRTGDKGLIAIPTPAGAPEEWEFLSGGAGLFGTAADYLRLLRMLLGRGALDGVRILRADTMDGMWADQIGDLTAGRLDTANPVLVLPSDPLPGQAGGWSLLGLHNRAAVAGGRSAGSASWAGVAGTVFWIDRNADLCGVLLAQLLPFADPALTDVQRRFEQAAYQDMTRLRSRRQRNAA